MLPETNEGGIKMADKEKKEPIKTSVWVFWIMIAIIGVGLLFSGLQGGVRGDSITASVMFIVVGIIFLFIGLIMIFGKANIEANDLEITKTKKETK